MEDHVGFGSDFDGAMMPKDLNSVTEMLKINRANAKSRF